MNLEQLFDPNFKHYSTQINKIIRRSGNVTVITSYVSIITFKPKKFNQGTKVTVIIDKNYHSKYQYTMYFDLGGLEITKKEFYKTK